MSSTPITTSRHPDAFGPVVPVYVWQYPLRLVHWGIVISIGVLSFTGYYIHDPFIVQLNRPFFMGWFRFVHEVFGMFFTALVLLRLYLFFGGNRWVSWREMLPLSRDRWVEMWQMMKFYLFISPTPVSKIGHNAIAALSYLVIYSLALIESVTGLVLYQRLDHNAFLGFLVGWIPGVIALQHLRINHFFLMFIFICFGIFHVHLCMIVSREEKRGLMDSIFIGYKIIPLKELEKAEAEEERGA